MRGMDSLVELFAETRLAALVAERDGNYDEALRLWRVLEGYIATTPDQEREGDAVRWRADVAAHVNRLERLVQSTRGIQQQRIEYYRPAPWGAG